MKFRRFKAVNGLFGIKFKITKHLIINWNLQNIWIFLIDDEVQKFVGGAYINFFRKIIKGGNNFFS